MKKTRPQFNEFCLNYEDLGDRKRLRTPKFAKVDQALHFWYTREKSLNHMVTDDMIQSKALFFHKKLGDGEDFRASNGYLRNFKKRYGIKRADERNNADPDSQVKCEESSEPEFEDLDQDSEIERNPIEIVDVKIEQEIEDGSFGESVTNTEALQAANILLNWLSTADTPRQQLIEELSKLKEDLSPNIF
jgi:hypothetical protein